MDSAYVDELATDNNDKKYLLVRQELFNRTVDAKRRKTKDCKESVCAHLTTITKNESTQTKGGDKGTEIAGEF